MESLSKQIAEMQRSGPVLPDEIKTTMAKATSDLKATGIEDKAIKEGNIAPEFCLVNHLGQKRSLQNYLVNGPVVLSFYRGGW